MGCGCLKRVYYIGREDGDDVSVGQDDVKSMLLTDRVLINDLLSLLLGSHDVLWAPAWSTKEETLEERRLVVYKCRTEASARSKSCLRRVNFVDLKLWCVLQESS